MRVINGNIFKNPDRTFTWYIEDFDHTFNVSSLNIRSPCFRYFAVDWCLNMFFCDYATDDVKFTLVRCKIESDDIPDTSLTYCLSIKDLQGVNYWTSEIEMREFEEDYDDDDDDFPGILLPTLNLKRDLKRITRGGVLSMHLTIFPEGLQTVEDVRPGSEFIARKEDLGSDSSNEVQRSTPITDSILALANNLKDLFVGGNNTDVTMNVNGTEFKAHGCILMARSAVFGTMFQHHMREKITGVIDIKDCDAESFKNFLIFLYTGDISQVTSSNAHTLYQTANMYQVLDLKQACASCMKNELNVESFCDVVSLASLHSETELLESATQFFIQNANKILDTENWKMFIKENVMIANELFMQILTNKAE